MRTPERSFQTDDDDDDDEDFQEGERDSLTDVPDGVRLQKILARAAAHGRDYRPGLDTGRLGGRGQDRARGRPCSRGFRRGGLRLPLDQEFHRPF